MRFNSLKQPSAWGPFSQACEQMTPPKPFSLQLLKLQSLTRDELVNEALLVSLLHTEVTLAAQGGE